MCSTFLSFQSSSKNSPAAKPSSRSLSRPCWRCSCPPCRCRVHPAIVTFSPLGTGLAWGWQLSPPAGFACSWLFTSLGHKAPSPRCQSSFRDWGIPVLMVVCRVSLPHRREMKRLLMDETGNMPLRCCHSKIIALQTLGTEARHYQLMS